MSSLPVLRVLSDESGDNLNDFFLLAAGELRYLFKNLMHLAGWTSLAGAFDLHLFTEQLSNRHAQDARGLAHELN